jgi:hypothetical protein
MPRGMEEEAEKRDQEKTNQTSEGGGEAEEGRRNSTGVYGHSGIRSRSRRKGAFRFLFCCLEVAVFVFRNIVVFFLWRPEVTAMVYVFGLGLPVIESRDLQLPLRERSNATVHILPACRRRAAVFRFSSSQKATQPALVKAFIDCATAAQSKWRVYTSNGSQPPKLLRLNTLEDVASFLSASRKLTGRSLRGRFFAKPQRRP